MADSGGLLLKIADSPVLMQFLHDCVDDLTKTKEANFDSYNSDIEWTLSDFQKTKIFVQKLYRENILSEGFDLSLDLPRNVQEEIKNCFDIRKDDIFEALVKENLVKNGHNLVGNYDWKLKWVLGSSKQSFIKEPLLQIDLHYIKTSESSFIRNYVNFEVDLEKLDLLIEQLEKAKNEIKHL